MVLVNDTMFMLCAKTRDGLSFDGFVNCMKRNGFIGGFTIADKHYVGSNGSKQCFVLNNPDNGYVTVEIEDAQEEIKEGISEEMPEVDVDIHNPRLAQLQKQMRLIVEEIKKHPEKAKELGEKLAKVSLEMQKELKE